MAHFVEHTIFKGTKKRKAWHILNRMENVGGDLNAYTNKEETVIYAAFMNEHIERAIELRDQLGELSSRLGDAKPKKTRAKKATQKKSVGKK